MKFLTFFLFFITFLISFGQDNIDSLKLELHKNHHDTIKCIILSDLVALTDDNEWPKFNSQLKTLTEVNLNKKNLSSKLYKFYSKYLATSLNDFGYLEITKGNSEKALDFYFKGLKIQQEIDDKEGIGLSLNNIGSIYEKQGYISKALEYYLKSLRIKEKLNNKQGIANSLNNIGLVYLHQGEGEKARTYFEQSLKIEKKLKNKIGIATSLHNLGILYFDDKDYHSALNYYQESLTLLEEINDEYGMAFTLNNIGTCYEKLKESEKALEFYKKSLYLREKNEDRNGISISLISISTILNDQGKIQEAMLYSLRALKLAQELGFPENIKNSARLLVSLYKKLHNSDKALEMLELYNVMRDSINSVETKKSAIKQQYKYEFEKRESVIKANQEKKNILYANQSKRQRIIIVSVIIGLIIVVVFLIIIFNRFKITQKQKEIISLKEKETQKQKEIVELKNKEILDSIKYAKRIQAAILPQDKLIKEILKQSFIFYRPKDIVAGDFYWLEQIDDHIFLAAADCTGHGVPGAMVSVVCHNALNRSIKEFNLKKASDILDKTREIVISEFEKSDEDVKDGMDISLCVIDKNFTKMSWAGANNPLWIVRDDQILEFKGDKQPIGKFAYAKPFINHEINLNKKDEIYVFTDGFQDQFGGNKGKKFKTSFLRQLVLKSKNNSMENQFQLIEETFDSWKKDYEQVDDVCMIGVKV